MQPDSMLTLDFISLASLLAAINMLYVAAFTWLEGRSLLTARLFTALALAGAWWGLCLGLAFTPWGIEWPQMLQMSQLTSGLYGPLILLYTLSYVGILRQWSWKWALWILPGLAGTLSFVLVLLMKPAAYDHVARDFIHGSGAFDRAAIAADLPIYDELQWLHSIQLLVLTLASVVIFVRRAGKMNKTSDQLETRMHAMIFGVLLVGIVLTQLLPSLGYTAWIARLAPILPLPFILVLWKFMRRRIDTAESLTRERSVLESYLPSTAADVLMASGATGGQKAEAAVLFSDLRGFTAMSESLDPAELIAWIDEFFGRMSHAILREQGMVDKLIGDAVLAIFGVPQPLDNPCESALRAALAMQQALRQLNVDRPSKSGVVVRQGIGIHFGELVAGTVGSQARRTYTVFGDTVNTASRIESLCKEYGVELLISGEVYDRLSAAHQSWFVPLGDKTMRGRQSQTRLYGVTNTDNLVI